MPTENEYITVEVQSTASLTAAEHEDEGAFTAEVYEHVEGAESPYIVLSCMS